MALVPETKIERLKRSAAGAVERDYGVPQVVGDRLDRKHSSYCWPKDQQMSVFADRTASRRGIAGGVRAVELDTQDDTRSISAYHRGNTIKCLVLALYSSNR
jgi:hypothetical protein